MTRNTPKIRTPDTHSKVSGVPYCLRSLVVRQGLHKPVCGLFCPDELHPLTHASELLMGHQLSGGQPAALRPLSLHPDEPACREEEDPIWPASLIVREKLHALPTDLFCPSPQVTLHFTLQNVLFADTIHRLSSLGKSVPLSVICSNDTWPKLLSIRFPFFSFIYPFSL